MTVSAEIETLIARVAKRDRRAFARLYDASSAQLFGLICTVLDDPEAAKAAMRDTYIKIWHSADHFGKSGQSARAWLNGLARNIAVDRLQRTPSKIAPSTDLLVQIYWRGDTYEDLAASFDASVDEISARFGRALDVLQEQLTP